jgi:hypothetical protein
MKIKRRLSTLINNWAIRKEIKRLEFNRRYLLENGFPIFNLNERIEKLYSELK